MGEGDLLCGFVVRAADAALATLGAPCLRGRLCRRPAERFDGRRSRHHPCFGDERVRPARRLLVHSSGRVLWAEGEDWHKVAQLPGAIVQDPRSSMGGAIVVVPLSDIGDYREEVTRPMSPSGDEGIRGTTP